MQWHIACIDSGKDRRVSRMLREREIECYIPYTRRATVRCVDSPVIDVPLFPGYAFLRFEDFAHQRDEVLEIPHVYRFLRFCSRFATMSDVEIDQVRVLAEIPAKPTTLPAVGVKVDVVAGPLAGMEGIVTRQRRASLIIEITMLGRAVQVPFEVWMVEERRANAAA